jgi:uncharacterized lipoprotein YmbA
MKLVSHALHRLAGCLLMASLGLSGCSFRQAAVDQRTYLLLPSTVEASPPSGHRGTLRVLPVSVASAFEGQGLVYRWDELVYRSDFYHQFMVSPRSLVTERLTEGLRQCRPFETVVSAGSPAEAGWLLEMTVNSLYGDWRSDRTPTAVVEVRYELIKAERPSRRVITNGVSRVEAPLSERTPAALVRGFSAGLDKVTLEIAEVLRRLPLDDKDAR